MNQNNPSVRKRDRIAAKTSIPGTSVRMLSVPEKMPGFSFSLPAGKSCPYMVLGKNAICGDAEGEGHKHCYAFRGHYIYKNIIHATATRFQWLRDSLKTPESTEFAISAMVECIRNACEVSGEWYFRWHDSGDIFSPAYARFIRRVCEALPDVHFWLPTRSWQATWVDEIAKIAELPNVTVRPSALHFEEVPPIIAGLNAGTSVSKDNYNCPASHQDNKCQDCRKCWIDKDLPIVYHKH